MSADSKEDAFFGPHPPKPVLTLRVGIVGHRPKTERYADGMEASVKDQIGDVFRKIDERVKSIAAEQAKLATNKENYYALSPPCVRLVSGLAEGADQWAVEAMPPGWTLDAVLPFPVHSYLEDFKKSAAVHSGDVSADFIKCLNKATTCVQLPEESRSEDSDPASEAYKRRRDEGYKRSGRFLLGQIDLLVAIWDGTPKVAPAGTAAMVEVALDGDIPVFWIHSLEKGFVRKISRIGDNGLPEAPTADCLESTLDDAIDRIVLPPADRAADFENRLGAFLKETPPRSLPWFWLIYDAFKRWHDGEWPRLSLTPRSKADYEADWKALIAKAPVAKPPREDPLVDRLTKTLLPRYAWADCLALEVSHRYRSTYFIIYFLAAMAVLIALLGIFFHDLTGDGRKLAVKAGLVFLEIVILAKIFFTVRTGDRERWHEKWVEYRSLAELLLNVRFLAYLGEHGRAHRMAKLESEPSAWFLWYLRATIREIGLPTAEFDGAYQWRLLDAVKEQVISGQCDWHDSNASTLRRMNQKLYGASLFCFFGTCFFLGAFLLGWLTFVLAALVTQDPAFFDRIGFGTSGPEMEKIGLCACAPFWDRYGGVLLHFRSCVVFFAALLPAAGAAFASIRETGDFNKVAMQSAATAANLQEMQDAFEQGLERLRFDHTDELLRRTAQVLTEDLSAWQSVYGHKRLELPA